MSKFGFGVAGAVVVVVVGLAVWKFWLANDARVQNNNTVDTFSTCAQYSGEKLETCKKEEKDKIKTPETVTKAINDAAGDQN
jgi:hypothetical protein